MQTLADRKKRRRDYLKRKRKGVVHAGMAWGFACATVVGFLVWLDRAENALNFGEPMIWITLWFLVRGSSCAREVSDLPYVPPVTVSILPAEEVLVRGCAPPNLEQADILLRAAQGQQETPQEELLRVGQGE